MEHDKEKCKEVFAMLSRYLDVDLPPDACQEVEKHLAGCPPCVEFAKSLRKTIELCHRYEPEQMPAPLSDQARGELLAAWRKVVTGVTARKP
jgi:RNA polymerase sigma-70 factor (ECF subfamily)